MWWHELRVPVDDHRVFRLDDAAVSRLHLLHLGGDLVRNDADDDRDDEDARDDDCLGDGEGTPTLVPRGGMDASSAGVTVTTDVSESITTSSSSRISVSSSGARSTVPSARANPHSVASGNMRHASPNVTPTSCGATER